MLQPVGSDFVKWGVVQAVERVKQKLQGKLRIGMPSITQLVYVGGTIGDGWLAVPGLPSSMFPFVGDEKVLSEYAI
jgi:hypothetical protein